jgi:CBS domain-containing protein
MLRLRTLPLARFGNTRVRLDPALPIAVAYLATTLLDRYRDSFALLAPAARPWPWALLVAGGILGGLLAADLVHVVTARAFGARLLSYTFSVAGARTRLQTATPLGVEWRSLVLGPPLLVLAGALALAGSARVGLRHAELHLALGDLGRLLTGLGLAQALPVFPFAGGRIVRAAAARRMGVVAATRLVAGLGKALAVAAIILAARDRYVLWLFVAVYLYGGAASEQAEAALAQSLAGLRARDAMRPVAGLLSVRDRLREVPAVFARAGASALPVVALDGQPVGAVAISDLHRLTRGGLAGDPVDAEDAEKQTLADVIPSLAGVAAAGADLESVRERLLGSGASAVAVVDAAGALAGVLTLDAIDRRITLANLER